MRFFATLVFVVLSTFCVTLPTSAASLFYDFSFSGVVQSAYETGPAIGTPIPENQFVGQAISEGFLFANNGSTNVGSAYVSTHLFGLILPLFVPNLSSAGYSVGGIPATLSFAGDTFLGSVGSSNSVGSFTFTYNAGNPSADVVTAQIPILSAGRADASGFINFSLETTSASFSVSTVPLPSALPLFALCLLALGAFGFVARKKSATLPRQLELAPI
jgi:hypothetical protein